MHRKLTLGLVTAAVLAFGASPALAVDETKPTPCAGVLFTDPSGDQQRVPLALGATPNMDVTSVFVTKKAGVTSFNLVIANLDKSVPLTALGGVDWFVFFTVGETTGYLRASTTGSDVSYEHGIDDPTNGLTPGGTIAGAFFEGADGVVQMDLPDTYSDQELKNIHVETAVNQIAVVAYADSAPDSQEGPNLTPVACDAAGPAAPGAPAAGSSPGTGSTTLPVSLPASAGSARKAAKAKKLSLKVDAKQPIQGLKLTLKRGKTTIATGTLASASGVKTVTLKLGRKAKLKKGTYVLTAVGKVDGKSLKLTRKIKVAA